MEGAQRMDEEERDGDRQSLGTGEEADLQLQSPGGRRELFSYALYFQIRVLGISRHSSEGSSGASSTAPLQLPCSSSASSHSCEYWGQNSSVSPSQSVLLDRPCLWCWCGVGRDRTTAPRSSGSSRKRGSRHCHQSPEPSGLY